MGVIAAALGPVFLLIIAGYVLRRLNFPGGTFWPDMERLTYYLLFPAMLIHKLGSAQIDYSSLVPIALSVAGMTLFSSLLMLLLRHKLADDDASFTSVFQGGIRFNTYIGMACAAALYGDQGVVIAAVALAVMIPLVNVLSVLVFHLTLHRAELHWLRIGKSLAKNPLILGTLIGIFLNLSGIGLPGWSAGTLSLLGSAALPLGLLAVGVALDVRAIRHTSNALLNATLVRFLLMPTLLVLLMQGFEFSALEHNTLLLFAILPTATSSFILSRQMGGNSTLMANIITLQTLAGFVFIPAWLYLLSL